MASTHRCCRAHEMSGRHNELVWSYSYRSMNGRFYRGDAQQRTHRCTLSCLPFGCIPNLDFTRIPSLPLLRDFSRSCDWPFSTRTVVDVCATVFQERHGKVGKAVNGRPCEATRFIGQVGRYIPAVYSTKRTFTAGFLKMLSKPAEKCGWAVRPSQGHTLPPQPNEDPVPNVLLLPDFAGSRPTAVAYISI